MNESRSFFEYATPSKASPAESSRFTRSRVSTLRHRTTPGALPTTSLLDVSLSERGTQVATQTKVLDFSRNEVVGFSSTAKPVQAQRSAGPTTEWVTAFGFSNNVDSSVIIKQFSRFGTISEYERGSNFLSMRFSSRAQAERASADDLTFADDGNLVGVAYGKPSTWSSKVAAVEKKAISFEGDSAASPKFRNSSFFALLIWLLDW